MTTRREVLAFLAVGGTGYVVDVAAFNLLRSLPVLATTDPAVARTLAVCVAMLVTYVGNRTLTRGDRSRHFGADQRREVGKFALVNLIGFLFSVVTLVLSHDVLGLTSRLSDNISANVVGMAMGTAFRFLGYRYWVFQVTGNGQVSDPMATKVRGTGLTPVRLDSP